MPYNPLTIGDVKKVLDCLGFTFNRVTARNSLLIYTCPDSPIEVFVPTESKVISHFWIKKILRRLEDCGVSAQDMIDCGLLKEK